MITHVADLLTIIIIAAVYALKTAAYLLPWRGLDRLRVSLALSALTWAVFWSVALLEALHITGTPAPGWFLWGVRICLIVFGIGNIVELLRAGAVWRKRRE